MTEMWQAESRRIESWPLLPTFGWNFVVDGPAAIRGPVVIEAIVDKEGGVSDARYLKGGDYPGAPRALEIVRDRRFRPAMLDGKPVAVYIVFAINP
jgi:hypothetical protein